MIDKWIIKTDGVLKFNSLKVCTESQYNKMTAGVNQQRIVGWCADNHCTVKPEKGEQYLSILTEVVSDINESEARNVDMLHDKFLEFVDSLPEIDAPDKTEQVDYKPAITLVSDILTDIHNSEIIGAIVVRGIGPFETEWGRISPKTLAEMCELYLNKYEHKDN